LQLLTKKILDSLCDILVNKFPQPQDQIDQITLGLMYKFASDMDSQSQEKGGSREFFVGDFEKYAWENLRNPKLSGVDKINLYKEALEKNSLNSNLPKLFRDIFKDQDQPTDDPKTFNDFFELIDSINYDISENFGDPYEYLLEKMGAQGKLGQFRTPSHIIDFIVRIVDPKKENSILDPACGTAGFLVSAYKHIKNNDLTSEELTNLARNLVGYDIEPKMIRSARVGLFLNKFKTPQIFEYDSISSKEKWNEFYDIILANPPFFTPKTGIKPHNLFSVSSKKTEVTFLSYIVEHLKPNGRAGVIIPNGVLENVKRSGKYYCQIRKLILESGLYCIVSLPEGVFGRYSPTTSTSILFFDKTISANNILRIEVENDGFNLGTQRYPINDNDLPEIENILKAYKRDLKSPLKTHLKFQLISKEVICEDEDISLDLRKYVNNLQEYEQTNKIYNFGDIFEIENGSLASTSKEEGKYDFITASETWEKHSSYDHDKEALVYAVSAGGSLGRCHYVNGKFTASNLCLVLTLKDSFKRNQKINLKYFHNYLNTIRNEIVKKTKTGTNKKTLSENYLKKYQLLIPKSQNELNSYLQFEKELNDLEIRKRKVDDEIKDFLVNNSFKGFKSGY